MAIVAVALAAGFRSVAQSAESATALKGRTLALWVAQNQLAAAQLETPGPAIGEREGSESQAGALFIWHETVIGHATEKLSAREDGSVIRLRDRLRDGVTVEHTITAGADEVDFRLVAHNPTATESQAHWAQPCMRVDKFTGCSRDDARALVPAYARKCFLFLDGKLTRLPTQPWADSSERGARLSLWSRYRACDSPPSIG